MSLLGSPGVQMGFNRDVAWAHTFSKGHRFTLARLDLVPGRPTAYRHGDDEREMAPTTHTVDVLGDDGAVTSVERTLWRTHHGPMVNLPLLGWGTETAFTYRDANLDNAEVVQQFLAMDRATSIDDLQASLRPGERACRGSTPSPPTAPGGPGTSTPPPPPPLSTEAQQRFRTRVAEDPVAALLFANRVALLDGSDPGDDWVELPGARSPGLVPYDELPQVERRDYVANANDSHWLSHPDAPLLGYSPLHGFERVAPEPPDPPEPPGGGTAGGRGRRHRRVRPGGRAGQRRLSAELLRDAVLRRLDGAGPVERRRRARRPGPGGRGAAGLGRTGRPRLGRRRPLAGAGRRVPRGRRFATGPALFAVPFDPDDPVATPTGLAPPPGEGPDPVLGAAARAAVDLARAGVALDAPLGEVQWAQRGDERVPVHGGGEGEGVLNILAPIGALAGTDLEPGPPPLELQGDRTARTGLRAGGYRCTYGTSFLMAVELTDDGPRARGLLAYGQSGDPRSPHHVDGTRAYAAKAPRPLLFTEEEIRADPELVERTVTGG